MSPRPEPASLAGGLAIVLVGLLLLLNEEGTVELGGGWLLACLAVATGIVLVASGLAARSR